MARDSILVNDRQLACARINSQEGQVRRESLKNEKKRKKKKKKKKNEKKKKKYE